MVVRGFEDAFSCTDRMRGLKDFLSENSYPIQIAKDIVCSTDDFVSYAIIKDTFKNGEPINVIYYTSGGVYGACRALETIAPEKKPLLICHDCTQQNVDMLKKGIVDVIIGQQPFTQGAQPLELRFDWIGMRFKPVREAFYTNISLNIKENISLY